MKRASLILLYFAWALAGCKSESGFSGSPKQTRKAETAAATATATNTKTSTKPSTGTEPVKSVGTATEPSPATVAATATSTGSEGDQHPGPMGEIDGHQVGGTCDQCFQIASNLAQAEGFTASKNAVHDYGSGIFQDAPALCDIHWLNPGGPEEVFTACDCSCF